MSVQLSCLIWISLWDRNICIEKPRIRVYLGFHAMWIWELGTGINIWLSQIWWEDHPALCVTSIKKQQKAERKARNNLGKTSQCVISQQGWIISGKTREKVNDHGWSLNSHQASVTAFYNLIKHPHPQVPQSRRRKDNHKAEQISASAFSSLPFQLQKVVPWTPGRSR